VQTLSKPITGISDHQSSRVTAVPGCSTAWMTPVPKREIQGLVCLYATQFERNQKRDGDFVLNHRAFVLDHDPIEMESVMISISLLRHDLFGNRFHCSGSCITSGQTSSKTRDFDNDRQVARCALVMGSARVRPAGGRKECQPRQTRLSGQPAAPSHDEFRIWSARRGVAGHNRHQRMMRATRVARPVTCALHGWCVHCRPCPRPDTELMTATLDRRVVLRSTTGEFRGKRPFGPVSARLH